MSMEEKFLIDRDTLGRLIDELIKQKTLPVDNVDELNTLREKSIKELDEKISDAIFGRLNKEQLDELNKMLDSGSASVDDYQEFYKNAGVNLEEVMAKAMQEYAADFLGGKNE